MGTDPALSMHTESLSMFIQVRVGLDPFKIQNVKIQDESFLPMGEE